jgi:hypothetical protein
MSRQNKKERHRLKRKKKQMQLRKERNTSIFRKLAQGPAGPINIYINADWREAGEASIMALRDAPGGGHVFVGFLIDFWCGGLKDAYGRADVTRDEFDGYLDRADKQDLEMIEIDLPFAQRLVAGAMRLSIQNGFRLPHRADRWASVIGVTAYADADLTDFEMPNGKYRYVGSMQDLRKRLVGPVDQFLSRTDVEFVIGGSAPLDDWEDFDDDDWAQASGGFDDDDDDDNDDLDDSKPPREFVEQIDELGDRAYVAVYNWLLGAGETPHPLLRDGVDLALTAAIVETTARENPDARAKLPALEDVLSQYEDPTAIVDAAAQVARFMQQFETPQRMLEAFGFDQGPDSDIETLLPHP